MSSENRENNKINREEYSEKYSENMTPEQQHEMLATEIDKAGHIATRKGASLYIGLAGIAFEISAIIDKTSGMTKQAWGSDIFIGICCIALSYIIYKLAKRDEQETYRYRLEQQEKDSDEEK